MIVYFILKDYNKRFYSIKTDIYLVYGKSNIWPTILYNVDNNSSKLFEIVKDSKSFFMKLWRVSRDGTNHPSIAQRGVSCSKVDLGEP